MAVGEGNTRDVMEERQRFELVVEAADGGGNGDTCTGASQVLGELNGWVEMAVGVLRNEKDMWVIHGGSVYQYEVSVVAHFIL